MSQWTTPKVTKERGESQELQEATWEERRDGIYLKSMALATLKLDGKGEQVGQPEKIKQNSLDAQGRERGKANSNII